jgi:hypothetical protein
MKGTKKDEKRIQVVVQYDNIKGWIYFQKKLLKKSLRIGEMTYA